MIYHTLSKSGDSGEKRSWNLLHILQVSTELNITGYLPFVVRPATRTGLAYSGCCAPLSARQRGSSPPEALDRPPEAQKSELLPKTQKALAELLPSAPLLSMARV